MQRPATGQTTTMSIEDADTAVNYRRKDGEEEGRGGQGNAPGSSATERCRCSNDQRHQSSSWVLLAVALNVYSDVGGNGNRWEALAADADSESVQSDVVK
jgi:hypothetical protein